jgi:hypothetical protein
LVRGFNQRTARAQPWRIISTGKMDGRQNQKTHDQRSMTTERPPPPPPPQLRFLLWMSFGYLLGLPVADLFAGVNLQTEILQRQIGKRRLSYTIAERLRLLDTQLHGLLKSFRRAA